MSREVWEASGMVKVQRAKDHVRDIERRLATYEESGAYRIVVEQCEDYGAAPFGEAWQYVAKVTEPPSPVLGSIIGEIAHDLVTALNIIWRLTFKPDARDHDKTFPFPRHTGGRRKDRKVQFDAFCQRYRGTGREPIMDVLQRAECHEGGNPVLERLFVLNDHDKHRGIMATLLAVQWKRFPLGGTMEESTTIIDVEDGTVLETFENPMEVDPPFSRDVAFGEPGICKGETVLGLLSQILQAIDGLLADFEPFLT